MQTCFLEYVCKKLLSHVQLYSMQDITKNFLAFIGVTNLKNLNNELELPYRMKIFTGIGILLLSWLTRHYMNLDSTFGQILQSQ